MTSQSPVEKKISKSDFDAANERRRRFYSTAIFEMPPQPKFRRWAMAMDSGYRTPKGKVIEYWKSVPRSICHKWQLREVFLKYLPSAVYFTTSRFGNAKNIGRRKKSKLKGRDNWALNQFHGAELYFDLDSHDYGNSLTKAYGMAGRIVGWLSERGLRDIRLYFSGRGWHIHALDWEVKVMDKVLENRFSVGKEKEFLYRLCAFKIVNMMRGDGLVFDDSITTDTRRVIRIPGSFNEKAMAKSEPFSTENCFLSEDSEKYHTLLDRLFLGNRMSESSVCPQDIRIREKPEQKGSSDLLATRAHTDSPCFGTDITPFLTGTMIEAVPKRCSRPIGDAASLGQASRGEGDRERTSRSTIASQDAKPDLLDKESHPHLAIGGVSRASARVGAAAPTRLRCSEEQR